MLAEAFLTQLARRELRLIADDRALFAPLRERGFRVSDFDDAALVGADTEAALVLVRSWEGQARLMTLWDRATAPLSYLELARFDPRPEAMLASLDLLLSMDLAGAYAARAAATALLLSAEALMVESGAGAALQVSFGASLELVNAAPALDLGEVYAIAEWLEAAVVNIAGERSSVCVEGEFAFDGLISVCNSPALRARWGGLLAELAEAARRGPNRVRFEDNRAVGLVVGGEDRGADLVALTQGRERGAALTELAIGCARTPLGPDWSMNSVLNKVLGGVHLGIGMAAEIPHLAFVALGARATR